MPYESCLLKIRWVVGYNKDHEHPDNDQQIHNLRERLEDLVHRPEWLAVSLFAHLFLMGRTRTKLLCKGVLVGGICHGMNPFQQPRRHT